MGALARLYTSFLLKNSTEFYAYQKCGVTVSHYTQDKKVCVVHDGFPIEEFESVSQSA